MSLSPVAADIYNHHLSEAQTAEGSGYNSYYIIEHQNCRVPQDLDVDTVAAEKFDYFRKVWRECKYPGPMPRTYLVGAVRVAETDEIAREEAEQALLVSRGLSRATSSGRA